jgi:hypothetical protein
MMNDSDKREMFNGGKGAEAKEKGKTKFKEKFILIVSEERLADNLFIHIFIYQFIPLPSKHLHKFTNLNPNTLTNFDAEYGVGSPQKTPPLGATHTNIRG